MFRYLWLLTGGCSSRRVCWRSNERGRMELTDSFAANVFFSSVKSCCRQLGVGVCVCVGVSDVDKFSVALRIKTGVDVSKLFIFVNDPPDLKVRASLFCLVLYLRVSPVASPVLHWGRSPCSQILDQGGYALAYFCPEYQWRRKKVSPPFRPVVIVIKLFIFSVANNVAK